MSTIGYSGSFSNYAYQNASYGNQFATEDVIAPCDMWVSAAHWYAGGDGGAINMAPCLWDSSDNLLWNGSSQSVPQGSISVNGQSWNSQSTGFLIKSGQSMRPGFWWQPGVGAVWSYSGSVSGLANTSAASSPANLTSTTTTHAGVGAYLDYTQVYAPTATTNNPTNITQTTATLIGVFSDEGWGAAGAGNTTWTLYLNTSQSKTGATTFTGSFSGNGVQETGAASGLTAGHTYYVLAEASNAEGTGDGSWVSFTTLNNAPPNAPSGLSPANDAAVNVAGSGVTLSWTFNAGSSGDPCTGSYIAFYAGTSAGPPTAGWYWWTGSAWSSTPTQGLSGSGTSRTIPASAFGSGSPFEGVPTLTWSVANENANGLGAYA
jgi:hypothetical protein